MAQICALCGKHKSPIWRHSKLRGKYNPTVKQHQKPNLQWVRFPLNWKAKGAPVGAPMVQFSGERVKACTKCMKALAKT